MSNYYLLSWKHKSELASAFALQEMKLDHDLIAELDGKNVLPFDFELRRVKETKDGLIIDDDLTEVKEIWLDYQPNNLAWPLMSERLKTLVDNALTGKEQIDWITCKVKRGDEERAYFILRFNIVLDVLDMQKTLFVQGTDHIIKPVFASSKISSHNIFTKPLSHNLWKITSGLYISDALKKAIQKQKLLGLDFEKTTVY